MRQIRATIIGIDNPFALPLLFILGGSLGFAAYQFVLDGFCNDTFFEISFFSSTLIAVGFVTYWARSIEGFSFSIGKLPSSLIIGLAALKIFVAITIIMSGAANHPDERLSAYGSSTLIILSGATSLLFFPIGYFAARTLLIKKTVLYIFIVTTLVSLVFGSSKSSLFGLFFVLLTFKFLQRTAVGEKPFVQLLCLKTFLMLLGLLAAQVVLMAVLYGNDLVEIGATLANRAMMNFDSAIYGCQVENNGQAPNSFFVYSLLSILKRFDSSLYNLDFFNVPQWLLYEVFSISREGRYGYPNDNLFVAIYFGGFRYLAAIIFLVIMFCLNFYIRYCLRRWKRCAKAGAIEMAAVMSLPLAYQSFQEFIGFCVILALIKIIKTLIDSFSPTKHGVGIKITA